MVPVTGGEELSKKGAAKERIARNVKAKRRTEAETAIGIIFVCAITADYKISLRRIKGEFKCLFLRVNSCIFNAITL